MPRTFASTIPCHVMIMTPERRAHVWIALELVQVIERQADQGAIRYIHCEPQMTIAYGEDERLIALPDDNLPLLRAAVRACTN